MFCLTKFESYTALAIHYLGHNLEDLKFFAIHPSLLRWAVGLQDVKSYMLPIKIGKRVVAPSNDFDDNSFLELTCETKPSAAKHDCQVSALENSGGKLLA